MQCLSINIHFESKILVYQDILTVFLHLILFLCDQTWLVPKKKVNTCTHLSPLDLFMRSCHRFRCIRHNTLLKCSNCMIVHSFAGGVSMITYHSLPTLPSAAQHTNAKAPHIWFDLIYIYYIILSMAALLQHQDTKTSLLTDLSGSLELCDDSCVDISRT